MRSRVACTFVYIRYLRFDQRRISVHELGAEGGPDTLYRGMCQAADNCAAASSSRGATVRGLVGLAKLDSPAIVRLPFLRAAGTTRARQLQPHDAHRPASWPPGTVRP